MQNIQNTLFKQITWNISITLKHSMDLVVETNYQGSWIPIKTTTMYYGTTM